MLIDYANNILNFTKIKELYYDDIKYINGGVYDDCTYSLNLYLFNFEHCILGVGSFEIN